MRPAAALSFVVCALASGLGTATVARAQWSEVDAPDLRLVYVEGQSSFLVPHVGRSFQNSMRFHRRLFDYEPSEKVTVLLTDFSDSGNAGATSVPRNSVTVKIAPLSFAFETFSANERMNTLMNHELVHVVSMDQATGSDLFFRRIFGGKVMPVNAQPETILYFYLTVPRVASPRWFLEGSAVFLDTWMAGGLGRAQGPWDEMVLRSMVHDRSHFYDPLGLVSERTKVDFQLEANSYLYGTRFMTWLALQHGPESVVRWTGRGPGSRAYYAAQFREVFGTGLDRAWADWITWERGFQEKNLARIRENPTTAYRDLSKRALGSVSRAHVSRDGGRLYAGFNYPGQVAHVGAISLADGRVEKLQDIKGPAMYTVTALAHDPETDLLFYTRDNNAYRDLVSLDPATGESRTLLKDARIGDLAFDRSDRSLWGIRHLNGICTLVRIPHPYREWKRIRSWPYGETVYDLDVSPDGKLLSASVGEISGRQVLRVFDRAVLTGGQEGDGGPGTGPEGDAPPLAEHEFAGAVPSNFVFSDDGRFLLGSSFYSGVSNIFRYEIATKDLQAMSNALTGFFRPVPRADGPLIVFRFSGEGFVPATIDARPLADVSAISLLGAVLADEQPVVKQWNVGSPLKVPFEQEVEKEGAYHSGRSLGLESFYPIVAGYKDSAAVGFRSNWSDPIQLARAHVTASYSPSGEVATEERWHAEAEYGYRSFTLRGRYNPADFYDLFGPTKTSRKGWSAGLGHEKTFVYDLPRQVDLSTEAVYWGGLETLPNYQNVPVSVETLFSARARLRYRNTRASLGHVDDEKGHRGELVVDGDLVEGRGFVRTWADFDLGFALPLGHSSIWLRNSAGFCLQSPAQPYSNFYFGGFGNNWVDHGDEKRYRAQYAFPGVELNEVAGRNYVRSMVEWNLPPLRFRRAGRPGLYLTWARTAVFASGLVTSLDSSDLRRSLVNVGAQVDLRFTLLSALDMTLSGGYAVAFEDGRPPRREAMVSLKVLR